MRPVRSTHSSTVLTDPWTGVHICGGRSDTVHGLEGRRWLRSVSILRPTVCVCGCLAPASGLCVLCRAIGGTGLVCARCFTHCATCRKPLCPAHSVPDPCAPSPTVRQCHECRGDECRRRLVRRVVALALSPFVERTDAAR